MVVWTWEICSSFFAIFLPSDPIKKMKWRRMEISNRSKFYRRSTEHGTVPFLFFSPCSGGIRTQVREVVNLNIQRPVFLVARVARCGKSPGECLDGEFLPSDCSTSSAKESTSWPRTVPATAAVPSYAARLPRLAPCFTRNNSYLILIDSVRVHDLVGTWPLRIRTVTQFSLRIL